MGGLLVALALLVGPAVQPAAAQRPAGGPAQAAPRPLARNRPATTAEVEQLLDRFVLNQARLALRLDARQMQRLAPRLMRLQAARRRAERQRQIMARELSDLTRADAAPPDEGRLAARMRELQGAVDRSDANVHAARQAVEDTLTVEQRARFLVFEQRMERRKLELLAEARRLAREGAADPAPPPDEGP